jgi:hypothetical protein
MADLPIKEQILHAAARQPPEPLIYGEKMND